MIIIELLNLEEYIDAMQKLNFQYQNIEHYRLTFLIHSHLKAVIHT